MTDLSTRVPSGMARRVATTLLRANGGTSACLQMPPTPGDSTNQGQLGLDAPGLQSLPLAPAVFRRVRAALQEGEPAQYELLLSADAVAAQVARLSVVSAEALFSMASGIVVAEQRFLIEAVSASEAQGEPYLYQFLLRSASAASQL